MKKSDLRVNDWVEYINGNFHEYATVVKSNGKELLLENNRKISDDAELAHHLKPIDIQIFDKAKIGFAKQNLLAEYESKYYEYYKCCLMGCVFELFRVRRQIEEKDIDDLGHVECCMNFDSDEPYGSWTMKCTGIDRIYNDMQFCRNLRFVHEIQHIVTDYIY